MLQRRWHSQCLASIYKPILNAFIFIVDVLNTTWIVVDVWELLNCRKIARKTAYQYLNIYHIRPNSLLCDDCVCIIEYDVFYISSSTLLTYYVNDSSLEVRVHCQWPCGLYHEMYQLCVENVNWTIYQGYRYNLNLPDRAILLTSPYTTLLCPLNIYTSFWNPIYKYH